MDKLIADIEALTCGIYDLIPQKDVIALIREAFEGKVLVPSEFLSMADCPNSECSDGAIARQVGDSEWEPEQCQWCHERSTMLAANGSDGT